MNKQLGKQDLKDEIKENCCQCGEVFTLAYWDFELESYIYLYDEDENGFTCEKCEGLNIQAAKKSKLELTT